MPSVLKRRGCVEGLAGPLAAFACCRGEFVGLVDEGACLCPAAGFENLATRVAKSASRLLGPLATLALVTRASNAERSEVVPASRGLD